MQETRCRKQWAGSGDEEKKDVEVFLQLLETEQGAKKKMSGKKKKRKYSDFFYTFVS